jgi:hypothetical protein
MTYNYIVFYSFVEKETGHTRHGRAEIRLKKAITSSDLLAFEGEQVKAGDMRAVVTGYKLVGIGVGSEGR